MTTSIASEKTQYIHHTLSNGSVFPCFPCMSYRCRRSCLVLEYVAHTTLPSMRTWLVAVLKTHNASLWHSLGTSLDHPSARWSPADQGHGLAAETRSTTAGGSQRKPAFHNSLTVYQSWTASIHESQQSLTGCLSIGALAARNLKRP